MSPFSAFGPCSPLPDLTGSDGQPGMAGREHFRTDVLLGPEDEVADRARHPGPAGGGNTVRDPYPLPDAPVRLSGMFDSIRDARATAQQAQARCTPQQLQAPVLAESTTPWLLTCAILRTAALRHGPELRQEVSVPRALEALDLFTGDRNDLDLAGSCGTEIRVTIAPDDQFYAISPNGAVLLHARGAQLAPLGIVPVETPGSSS